MEEYYSSCIMLLLISLLKMAIRDDFNDYLWNHCLVIFCYIIYIMVLICQYTTISIYYNAFLLSSISKRFQDAFYYYMYLIILFYFFLNFNVLSHICTLIYMYIWVFRLLFNILFVELHFELRKIKQ